MPSASPMPPSFFPPRPSLLPLLAALLCPPTSARTMSAFAPSSAAPFRPASSALSAAASPSPLSVAIIGGGVAGLSCARHLSRAGLHRVVVFDTGRLRVGGRCSSRLPDPAGAGLLDHLPHPVDHAAQLLVDAGGRAEWTAQVRRWEAEGAAVRLSPGAVAAAGEDGAVRAVDPDAAFYRGGDAAGMNAVPLSLAREAADYGTDLRRDVWVSPGGGVRRRGDRWEVKGKGGRPETFDRLVVAHNGKCADRLMSKTPAKGLHSLLRTDFKPRVSPQGGRRMTLNSLYSLTVALESPSPLAEALRRRAESEKRADGVACLFVRNEPALRFLSCASRKYDADGDGAEVWTVLSSPTFASKHKAPQENLPPATIANVTDLLLRAVERSLDVPAEALRPLDARLQLWGAAVPLNTWEGGGETPEEQGFLFDHAHGVGVCGDWLLEPSLYGAWESGRRLARWMERVEKEGEGEKEGEWNVGLPEEGGKFVASPGAKESGIGSL